MGEGQGFCGMELGKGVFPKMRLGVACSMGDAPGKMEEEQERNSSPRQSSSALTEACLLSESVQGGLGKMCGEGC